MDSYCNESILRVDIIMIIISRKINLHEALEKLF